MKKVFVVIIMTLILISLAYGLTHTIGSSGGAGGADLTVEALTQVPWFPTGFTRYDNSVAYRFLEKNEYTCSYSGWHCGGIMVVAHYGCQNLYAEVTIFDSSDNNIGWTNDTASGVRAGEKVKLIFDFTEDSVDKYRVSKISCY